MNADEYNQQQLEQQQMEEEMEGQTYNEFAGEVWKRLSSIDVNKHTEKKGKFTYLSWCWAWTTLQENYPASNYECLPTEYHEGESGKTATVWIDLTVSGDKYDITRRMWLPVLNYQNKPVVNPDAMDIQNARMRCLVKAMAMFGLGSYIYSGEDLPNVAPEYQKKYNDRQLEAFNKAFQQKDGVRLFRLEQAYGNEVFGSLRVTIEASDGKSKTAKREEMDALVDSYSATLDEYVILINDATADGKDVADLMAELPKDIPEAMDYVINRLTSEAKVEFVKH
tara:strand:- start:732 stop:1574 length:843 start_codon:yes stop_codon:yes gene_type:complete